MSPNQSADKPEDSLLIAGRRFTSRLFLGSGKFSSEQAMARAIEASASEMVTVALRRVDFNSNEAEAEAGEGRLRENLLEVIDRDKIQLLPNTSGAATAEEAVRLARLARAMGCGNWVKLEIHPNPRHLMPDPIETLKAAEILVAEDFIVLPYIHADPMLARRLEDAGCATVMPLGAAIGSNRGLQTVDMLQMIISDAGIPVVVDAGIGRPSHAAAAMELGADAVLVNTAIAVSPDPAAAARAFKLAVEAGRLSCLADGASGLPAMISGQGQFASATSPLTAFLEEDDG